MQRSCPDYNTLCETLSPLVTEAWKPQLNNLALFVYGLLLAGHVHLPKIALTLPVTGNTRNALQRLAVCRRDSSNILSTPEKPVFVQAGRLIHSSEFPQNVAKRPKGSKKTSCGSIPTTLSVRQDVQAPQVVRQAHQKPFARRRRQTP